MATAFGSAAGGGALLGRVLIVALVVWVVYLAAHRRSIPRRAIACLLAIAAEYTIVGIVRAQLEVDASLYTRYAYLSGILALIAARTIPGGSRRHRHGDGGDQDVPLLARPGLRFFHTRFSRLNSASASALVP